MTIEKARARALPKPWGVFDLRPFADTNPSLGRIGELWYERSTQAAEESALLLKLIFTSEPLSIQVHPDDAYAHSTGLPRGKTEAWYVIRAEPDAKIALGLKRRLTPQQLREAISDGSIADLVVWHPVSAGDTIFVPAGTIHAIGAGLVLAEIQQRSDVTYRLFDYGRHRALHVDDAIAVASIDPSPARVMPARLSTARTVLVSSAYFVFEKFELAPGSRWSLNVEQETWLLVIAGAMSVGPFDLKSGDAVFVQDDRTRIQAGNVPATALVAYASDRASPNLLQPLVAQESA
jgi:mannose-6-phosphate isomerase